MLLAIALLESIAIGKDIGVRLHNFLSVLDEKKIFEFTFKLLF